MDAMARTSFALMRETKGISATEVYCCPTMDIVALITTDHHVLVYQSVEWKKLLHIQPSDTESEVTHAAWRPCGKTLAIGRRDGQVHLYDIEAESDSLWQSFDNVRGYHHSHPIAALSWTNVTGCAASKMKDLTPSYVMNPPSTFSDTPTTYTSISAIPEEHHHILLSADTHGTILVRIWGDVCLARLDTHLTNIQHIYMPHGDVSSALVATTAGELLRYSVGTCPKELLFVVGHHLREIQALWAAMTATLKQIQAEWGSGVRLFEAKFRLLPGEYAKYGCTQVPQMHLYSLLCSGLCYPALELFLTQYLQEQSVLKMQKTFAHGCRAVDSLLHDHLVPRATAIVFRLSELRGLARFHSSSLEPIGMGVASLSALITSVEALVLQASALQRSARETAVDFGLFLDWVGNMSAFVANKTATGSLNPVDTQRLGRFLDRAYRAAMAHRKDNPSGGIELTFGNPVHQSMAALVDENARVTLQWTSLLDLGNQATAKQPATVSQRLALPSPHASILFGPEFTLCFGTNAPFLVLDTATWATCSTPRRAPSFQVVQARMYIREASSPRVAVIVTNGDRAFLQLVPVENEEPSRLDRPDKTKDTVRSRELVGWPTVASLAANGTRGVLCVLSHDHSAFAMFDGECDDDDEDDE